MSSAAISSKPKPKPLPFVYTFSFGAFAGCTELMLLFPLDTVKTRMQLNTGKSQFGMIGMLKDIVAKEGVGRLYRGILAPFAMEAPKRATKFAANAFWGDVFTKKSTIPMTQSISILTGCAAGATESFLVTPFELVKIRLQDKASTFTGPLDVIKKTLARSGPLGLYVGMEATFWRHVSWNGGYFGSIFQIRSLLPKAESKSGELFNNFLSGSVGGAIGTVLNTPFDVVKSRIQLHGTGEWAFPALVRVVKEEGVGALYKGFTPKVLRLAPGGGVLLLVVEALTTITRNHLGPPYV
ncbi:hypothetical protein FFLO_03679 [Filobasidium floriforme]|uniref:Mitochondrial carrier n=1 Tax=Filobasidium floriforme TaxID=5210 RepID=A0A8K0JKY1_9TREE|nr:putative organic acid transporter [Filobasidium floriforme]KAG7532284.1 hypothetical protein FFLO_03679 [Filobasidium floriforme]KAH8084693.1 putative organic acid transporter [Filobasidium floriforme]